MKLKIISLDPLKVLGSTRHILAKAEFVSLNIAQIPKIAKLIVKKFDQGMEEGYYQSLGPTGNFEDDIQLIFVQNTVNFCFWPDKNQRKWQVEWPKGNLVSGGYFGLIACFERALAEKVPILRAEHLASITAEDVKHLFRSANKTEIPLLKERRTNLQETGRILLRKFNGNFINVLNKANNDAVKLVKLIYQNFPSFKDIQIFKGGELFFLKRAQLCANDISNLNKKKKGKHLRSYDLLTAFSDYKLPQIMRQFNLLKYEKSLANKVDNLVLISQGSQEEIEIRAATIWGVELIRQELKKLTAAQIDNALWFASQDLSAGVKPYHRTRTIYY